MYEFIVYYRNTNLVAGPAIWAASKAAARRELNRQEGSTAKAFDVRQTAL